MEFSLLDHKIIWKVARGLLVVERGMYIELNDNMVVMLPRVE